MKNLQMTNIPRSQTKMAKARQVLDPNKEYWYSKSTEGYSGAMKSRHGQLGC